MKIHHVIICYIKVNILHTIHQKKIELINQLNLLI